MFEFIRSFCSRKNAQRLYNTLEAKLSTGSAENADLCVLFQNTYFAFTVSWTELLLRQGIRTRSQTKRVWKQNEASNATFDQLIASINREM